jgi:hypothetical protein
MRSLLVALVVLASAAPVAAAPNCLARGGSGTYPVDDDGRPSESRQLEIDTMRLRGAGYNPLWVARWSGCIKVTYREDGQLVTEYLDPISLEPVS